MTGLEQEAPATLDMLALRMKDTMREFAMGERDLRAPYGASTFELAMVMLNTVTRECEARGIPVAGPDVTGLIQGFKDFFA